MHTEYQLQIALNFLCNRLLLDEMADKYIERRVCDIWHEGKASLLATLRFELPASTLFSPATELQSEPYPHKCADWADDGPRDCGTNQYPYSYSLAKLSGCEMTINEVERYLSWPFTPSAPPDLASPVDWQARNTETGSQYETVATGTGNYTLAHLPAGTYQLDIEASGFPESRSGRRYGVNG